MAKIDLHNLNVPFNEMEVVVENLVKKIVDASIKVKSNSDCIDDCEYRAAKKLLKRHKNVPKRRQKE